MRFQKERLLIDDESGEEDVIAVYIVSNRAMTCKAVFLPHHLANHWANDYDRHYMCMGEVYTACSLNITKRQKRQCNHSCCMAKILRNKSVFSL